MGAGGTAESAPGDGATASSRDNRAELDLGPVLRGASFVHRAGARFHLVPADIASGHRGAAAGRGTTLELANVPSPDELVRLYEEHRGSTGEDPHAVALPSGARWVRDNDAPTGGGALHDVMRDRVVLITGAAQGFGWELARGLAAQGAVIALADMNIDGARTRAAELGAPHTAIEVNVGDEESVRDTLDGVVRRFGGLDVLVSNAGVLRAGSVKELALNDFRFVTDVNYVGFFLTAKYAGRVMEAQFAASEMAQARAGDVAGKGAPGAPEIGARLPRYLTDIVEINSKSGLEGSNKNGAYAGSKFGGIGLVQSFALELVEQGTKVNALCPGNFLDGPLWSDPDRGLFVQYLRAGKVPGAETIADVRRFYESKVPMGRGCTGADVLKALVYVVDQEYETGQAVPITGGQVMLS